MEQQDWIEQDEFERRRALFAGKAKEEPSEGSGYKVPELITPTAPIGRSIQVTVKATSGQIVFGPEHVNENFLVLDLLRRLRADVCDERQFARITILSDTVLMIPSETIGVYCDSRCSEMELTIVYSHPLPSGAKCVGDLAVWSVSRKDDDDDGPLGICRRRPCVKKLRGVSRATGEIFAYDSSVGRCTSVTLRLGNQGLYYNSSSHGTATLAYNTYENSQWVTMEGSIADESDDDSGEDSAETSQAIIPGPHCHGPKKVFALAGARLFAEKLAEAICAIKPKGNMAKDRVDVWEELCQMIGVDGSWFSCMYMPWIDKLGSMNEYEAFQWRQSGHPNTIAAIKDEQARGALEKGCTPEGAY